ncbi:MAG: SurA N-terminal domain-containing protein [Gammaproteobacteria bacterium]
MLQAMRERITGVLGWAVIGLIILTFALFGLGSYLEDKSSAYVAKVNDKEISPGQLQQAIEGQRARMQSMMGDAYNPSLVSDEFLKSSAIDSVVQQEVILQAAEKHKFTVSNQYLVNFLQAVPNLQEDGKFSQEKYQQLLFSRGVSAKVFEEDVRKSLQSSQFLKGFEDTAFITESELLSAFRIQQQKRDFAYLIIAQLPFTETVTVTDEEVKAQYETNSSVYMEPERVKVEYVSLRQSDLELEITIDSTELEEYYQERKESLIQQEQRRASHILIDVPAGDDSAEEAAEIKAENILDELLDGAEFSDLVGKYSSDPGSVENDGDLGFFGKGAMVPEFEAAAFSMAIGDISELVRSQFGFHIIKLTDIKASKMKAFEEARMELEAELKNNQAAEVFYEKSEQLTDLSYESPGSLEAVVEDMGLKIDQSDWLNRGGGPGVGQFPALLAAIFSEDVLESGNNSTTIEVGQNEVIVARILDRESEKIKPFESVEGSINVSLLNEKAGEQAKVKGEELLAQARKGTSLKSFEQLDKRTYTEVKDALRTVSEHSRDVVDAAFKQQPGAGSETVYSGQALPNGDYVIIRLDAVNEPDTTTLTDTEKSQLRRGFERMFGQTQAASAISNLKENAVVEILSDTDE